MKKNNGLILILSLLTFDVYAEQCRDLEPSLLPPYLNNSLSDVEHIAASGSTLSNIIDGSNARHYGLTPANNSIHIDAGSYLSFCSEKAIDTRKGHISFWYTPSNDIKDINKTHYLLDAGPLKAFIWNGNRKYFTFRIQEVDNKTKEVHSWEFEPDNGGNGMEGIVSAWKAGERHHISLEWNLDLPPGQQFVKYTIDNIHTKTAHRSWGELLPMTKTFTIGSRLDGKLTAKGDYDNLIITNQPNKSANDPSITLHADFHSSLMIEDNDGADVIGGVSFEDGWVGQGANIANNGQRIIFQNSNTINNNKGTISLNFKPDWNGTSNTQHRFLLDAGSIQLLIYKPAASEGPTQGRSYLVFRIVTASNGKPGVSTVALDTHADSLDGVSSWQEDEWHKIEASWNLVGNKKYLTLFMDGKYISERIFTHTPEIIDVSDTISIGSTLSGLSTANGTIDELSIYDKNLMDMDNPVGSYQKKKKNNGIHDNHETIHNAPSDALPLDEGIFQGETLLTFQKEAPFEKVFEGSVPEEREITSEFHYEMAKGEKETLFFNVYSRDSHSKVKLSISNIENTEKEKLTNKGMYLVKNWWQAGTKQYKRVLPEYTPELLIKNDHSGDGAILSDQNLIAATNWSIDNLPTLNDQEHITTSFQPDTSRQFALVVDASTELSAGIYHATVDIRDDQDILLKQVSIAISVRSFTLDKPNKDFMIYHRARLNSEDDTGGMSEERYNQQLKDMLDHGINGLTLRGSDDSALTTKLNFIQSYNWQPRVMFFEPAKENLSSMVELGFEPWFMGIDEPFQHDKMPEHVTLSQKIHALGGGELPNGKVITAITYNGYLSLKETFKEPLDYANLLIENRAAKNYIDGIISGEVRDSDKQSYYWQSLQENPSINRTLFGFYLWLSKLDGVFPYAYQHILENPYNDFDRFSGDEKKDAWRDHLTTYPSATGPIPTIQWEALREGIDDYRYLQTWQRYKNLIAGNYPAEAVNSEERVNASLDVFKDYDNISKLTPSHFHQTRNLIAQEITDFIVLCPSLLDSQPHCIPPNQAPTISVLEPSIDRNHLTLSGTALDMDGNLSEVRVQLDNSEWIPVQGLETWSIGFDNLTRGSHTYAVQALDSDNLSSDIFSGTAMIDYECIQAFNYQHYEDERVLRFLDLYFMKKIGPHLAIKIQLPI